MMSISCFQDSKGYISQDQDLYYLQGWQYFLHKRVILFPILGMCTPNRLYKPLSERINMKCKCDWVRSEIRENLSITSGQWESRVEYLGDVHDSVVPIRHECNQMSSKTGSQDVLMVHLAHREDVCVSLPQKPVTAKTPFLNQYVQILNAFSWSK